MDPSGGHETQDCLCVPDDLAGVSLLGAASKAHHRTVATQAG
jgi:hypothetical protein